MAGIAASDSVATTGLPAEVPTGRGFRQWLDRKAWRDTIIVIPFIWLLLFFLLPFFIIFVISLGEATIAQPPVQFNADMAICQLRQLPADRLELDLCRAAISIRFSMPPSRPSSAS